MQIDVQAPEVKEFLRQSDEFIAQALLELGLKRINDLPKIIERPATEIRPLVIDRPYDLSEDEKAQLVQDFTSEQGIAFFSVRGIAGRGIGHHPMFDLVQQLRFSLRLDYPLEHPLERHPDVIKRFGFWDGTVKIFDLKISDPSRYKEQGETSGSFDFHHDGLGSGGTVDVVLLFMDSPAASGGTLYFANMVRLGLELARIDIEAFRALFIPDALNILRPRGKGALLVQCPALYLNDSRQPSSFFRVGCGEYRVVWKSGIPALDRARLFLECYARPFGNGTYFLNMGSRGDGCFVNNRLVAHGRTAFENDEITGKFRVLSRKW